MNEPDPILALTAAEREALHLLWTRRASAKEIAREIGVSHHAVKERLRSARARLGVETSVEAAKMLADVGIASTYTRGVVHPDAVATEQKNVPYQAREDDAASSLETTEQMQLREERVAYTTRSERVFDRVSPGLRKGTSGLTPGAVMMWIGALALLAVVMLGGLIAISNGVVRLLRLILYPLV